VNRGLVAGRQIRLELDVQQRDRYGRLLAYVYVGDHLSQWFKLWRATRRAS
jgi:endonuclease YncB( thermonuclease family)